MEKHCLARMKKSFPDQRLEMISGSKWIKHLGCKYGKSIPRPKIGKAFPDQNGESISGPKVAKSPRGSV